MEARGWVLVLYSWVVHKPVILHNCVGEGGGETHLRDLKSGTKGRELVKKIPLR